MLYTNQLDWRIVSMKSKLAMHGGNPSINTTLEKYKWVNLEVMPRIEELIKSNSFSGFLVHLNVNNG